MNVFHSKKNFTIFQFLNWFLILKTACYIITEKLFFKQYISFQSVDKNLKIKFLKNRGILLQVMNNDRKMKKKYFY